MTVLGGAPSSGKARLILWPIGFAAEPLHRHCVLVSKWVFLRLVKGLGMRFGLSRLSRCDTFQMFVFAFCSPVASRPFEIQMRTG
jgi:hypothetical protein